MSKKVIKVGPAGAMFIKHLKKQMQDTKERMEKNFPPKEISDFIKQKTDEVNELNKGKLNKSDFALGMICMWHHLKDKINHE
jgi:hypothetical protein